MPQILSRTFKSKFCILVTNMFHNSFKIEHAYLLTSVNQYISWEREKTLNIIIYPLFATELHFFKEGATKVQ